MTEYKYRKNINDKDGNTIGCKEIIVPSAIVKQIRADAIEECIAKITELNSNGNEVWWHTMCNILEQLKEQSNGNNDFSN